MNYRIKILLVEDDLVDQMAFERMIKKNKLPYNYQMASSVTEAKNILKTENFDIVITDYNLGDGTGNDILDVITKNPVIVTTGAGDEEIAVKAMRSGAYDYLIKDTNRNYLKVLPLTIERALNDHYSSERLRLLESVVVNGNDAVLITDNANLKQTYPHIIYTNKAFKEMTGYDESEVIGKNLQMFFGPETNRRELSKIRKALMSSSPVRTELICYKKNGETYWNDINIVPVENERNIITHWVSVHRDISQRKYTEKALINAKIMAEESMKSKERFLANMSHEIRTPMNAVIGMTNLLLNNTSLTTEQTEYVEIIKQSSDNLLVIINDILDFSKIESGKITFESAAFSLSNLVQKVISILNVKASQKGLKLVVSVDSLCPDMIVGDSVRLNQILVNLVGNAIKFTHEGRVEIKIDVESSSNESAVLRISVIDTGIGVAEEKLKHIFDSFSQAGNDTTRLYGGTGLGLAITKQLIELQGGKIWVQSHIGKGSTFCFNLPFKLSQKEIEPVTIENEPVKTVKFHGRHILLVEDNYFNQVVAKKTLQSFGVTCDIAENGLQALDKLKINHAYELILMDIQMPEMDGYETTSRIRTQEGPYKNIPIIAMTAGALKGDDEKCLNAGMNAYISKPFNPEYLLELLAKHLPQQKQPVESPNKQVDDSKKSSIEDELKKTGLNLDYLLQLSGGNKEFIIEMIQLFIAQSPDFLEDLHNQAQQRKWENLSKTAHKFLSSVGYMGLNKEADLLRKVEENAKKGTNLENLPGIIAEIVENINILQVQLKQVFSDYEIAV